MTPEQSMKKIISERGLKLKYVCEKTGIPYSRLQPCLSGRLRLRADEWIELCVFLNLDVREALGGEGEG